jgi:hypothetical protein
MNRMWLGAFLGVAVGGVDVLLMLPLKFEDRTSALLGAFCSRFALGFSRRLCDCPCRRSGLGSWSDC